ncbi:MAG: sulfate adenylyltransferase, partial [Syntrophobacterales bacterium CG23_combo_of_CG06-09_8_20_14_all_48_27]
ILQPKEAVQKIKGLKSVPIGSQMANEVINIAYGWFSPLKGFMNKADADAVCNSMRLTDGTVWSIPIIFDMGDQEIADYGVKEGDTVLLTYQDNPLAILEVEEIWGYDIANMCKCVYGTGDPKHPGVSRTCNYKNKFLGGPITLVNRPRINPPYEPYFIPPLEMRKRFKEKGWVKVVAHQTRNVPHTGHEWL